MAKLLRNYTSGVIFGLKNTLHVLLQHLRVLKTTACIPVRYFNSDTEAGLYIALASTTSRLI